MSVFLTILLGWMLWRRGGSCARREGFANANANVSLKDLDNPLISLIGKVKKMGAKLLDQEMWVERIEMSRMNPTQLARRYIYQQMKKKQPE